jgi:hypothetical protein
MLAMLSLFLMFLLFRTGMTTVYGQANDDTRSLARLEQKLIDILEHRKQPLLDEVLASDFIYTNEAATLGKREFIAMAENLGFVGKRIELSGNRLRVYENAAVSTGNASVRTNADIPVKGTAGVASGSATVNLGKLSDEEKQPPPPPRAEPRAVPSPMPVPQDRPVPAADARYRYTATYVRLRGRWQMVALHLSRATSRE